MQDSFTYRMNSYSLPLKTNKKRNNNEKLHEKPYENKSKSLEAQQQRDLLFYWLARSESLKFQSILFLIFFKIFKNTKIVTVVKAVIFIVGAVAMIDAIIDMIITVDLEKSRGCSTTKYYYLNNQLQNYIEKLDYIQR